ncbi:MAG: hypothetical protein ACRDGQ_11015 [Candidatus Limnocylindrales bacterium]
MGPDPEPQALAAGPSIAGGSGAVVAGHLPAPASMSAGPRLGPGLTAPDPVPSTSGGPPPVAGPGWPGLGSGGTLTNLEPADSSIAVGPDSVVQVVNAAVRFTDRAGKPSIADIGLAAFFGVTGRTVSSARVLYDPAQRRWLALEESWDCRPDGGAQFGRGFIDLAVSQTTDPTGTWTVYNQLEFDDALPDQPTIGVSTDKVGVSANLYPITTGCAFEDEPTSYVAALDWSALLAGRPVIGSSTTDPDLFGIQVAGQVPPTSPILQFIGQADNGSGDLESFSATGTTAGSDFAFGPAFDLAADGIVGPSLALGGLLPQQPGPVTVTADIDNRLTAAAWQAGRLVAVSTYPCRPVGDSADRLCVRLTELDTSAANASTPPSRVQDVLLDEPGRDSYVGGVGLAADGTLHVVFNRSSASPGDFISSYEVVQPAGDPPGQFSPATLLGAGQAAYAGHEWGTYTGLAQDPQVAASVWQAGPYAAASGGWATFVDRLGQTAPDTYVPISSVRVVDSRDGSGSSGLIGKFLANSARSFKVAGSSPSIPAAAVAVTGNLTVTGQTGSGYVALTPDPTNTPATSSLNFPLGDIRANNVTIPLNAAGQLAAVYKASAGRTTDLVFDVTGYFVNQPGQATYVPLAAPIRGLDSRFGLGLTGPFSANVARTLQVSGPAGVPGIPTGILAISGNLTVTNQTQAGYLAITTDPTNMPPTSNLNFPRGDVRANGFTARLDPNGALSIVYKAASGTTDVVLDITGYFEAGSGGLSYYPLNPGRIMDTRPGVANSGLSGAFAANVSRTLQLAGHWGVPAGAGAVTGNLTVTGQTAAGYVALTPDPTTSPGTSTLNFPLGDTRANGLFGPLNGSGAGSLVYIARHGSLQLIFDVSGYFQ